MNVADTDPDGAERTIRCSPGSRSRTENVNTTVPEPSAFFVPRTHGSENTVAVTGSPGTKPLATTVMSVLDTEALREMVRPPSP